MLSAVAAQNWAMFLVRGVLAIALGVLIFLAPGPSVAALILLFAVYAIVDGFFATAVGLASSFSSRWLFVAGGVLAIAVGIYTLVYPGVTAVALALLIGVFAIARGASELAFAITHRRNIPGAWLYVLSGVLGIVFGAFLVLAPGDGAVALLLVIGYYALFAGAIYLAIGIRLRGLDKELTAAPSTSAS
jgi:uncharacterized membrane protein HdeD (DUF308 family)